MTKGRTGAERIGARMALGLGIGVALLGTVTTAQAAARPAVASMATRAPRAKPRHGAAGRGVPATLDGRKVVRVLRLVATAYGSSAQDNYPYGATNYFGAPLTPGTVAVDPSQIPLGTRLVVKGYADTTLLPKGGFVGHALDTGGAIGPDRIDIYLDAPNAAVQRFGIESVTAYVLGAPVKST